MARRLSLAEAKRMGFNVLSEAKNPIPIEWAEDNERRLAEQGWGDFTICLIDATCADGGEAIGGCLIGFFAQDLSRVRFDGTTWHEAAHNLQHIHGMEDYPRSAVVNTFQKGSNLAEVTAEDFRQTFAPPDAAKIPHKYADTGYGLGYEMPLILQWLGGWLKRQAAVRKWWLLNCHKDFVELAEHPERITYGRIQELMVKHGLK